MTLSKETRRQKIRSILIDFDFDNMNHLLDETGHDSVSPAICVQPNCNYTTEMEQDQDAGYCEECGGQTVQSALVLAGYI